MSSLGTVIPVLGLNFGFIGQVSRTGGGDPFIVSKQANSANAANINFGDVVVVLPTRQGVRISSSRTSSRTVAVRCLHDNR